MRRGPLLACLLLCGCPVGGLEATAVVSEAIPTVVTVSWDTDEPCRGRVEFGPDPEPAWRSPDEAAASTHHEVVLLGLRQRSEAWFRVRCAEDVPGTEGIEQSVTTGSLPAWPMDLAPDGGSGPLTGLVALPTLGLPRDGAPGAPVIVVDGEGEPVWFDFLPENTASNRARASVDGRSLLYLVGGTNTGQGGEDTGVLRVSWDGTRRAFTPLPWLHHDFVQLPDGTLAGLARRFEQRPDGTWVSWEQIVEVPPDGGAEVVFDGAEHAEADLGITPTLFEERPEPGAFVSAPAANFLHYDPEGDAYWFNAEYGAAGDVLGNQRAILRFDRAGRRVSAILGGPRSTFAFDGGMGAPWVAQHGLDLRGDRLVVFANNVPTEDCSGAVELELDEAAGRARTAWAWRPEPCRFVAAPGTLQRLEGGHTTLFWSTQGGITELDADQEVVASLGSAFGMAFGYGVVLEGLREPL